MKKLFNVVAAWILLLSNCNLLYALYAVTPDEFISGWENDSILPNNLYYNGSSYSECDVSNPVRGCVKNAKNQMTGSFSNPGDVEIRKLVIPTDNLWEFAVHLLVRGKTDIMWNSCAVVVFDKSESMAGGCTPFWGWTTISKFRSAVTWAVAFSDAFTSINNNTKVWLVTFSDTASVTKNLDSSWITFSNFNSLSPNWKTNIHDWLIKAYSLFSWAWCSEKNIVLLSDWEAGAHMIDESWEWSVDSSDPLSSGHNKAAVSYATSLKKSDPNLKIYSIWYSAYTEWEDTLRKISSQYIDEDTLSDDDHQFYFPAWVCSSNNVINVFSGIWANEILSDYWTISSITDDLWENFIWNSLNTGNRDVITNSWNVYTFSIKINPDATLWNNSNSWLTLEYKDGSGVSRTLYIPPESSSEIYWESPKCSWNYPDWDWVLTWKWEFSQFWNNSPSVPGEAISNNGCSWLCPKTKMWTWVDSNTPWECEWTCMSWYQINQHGDWCEEIITKHEVDIIVDPAWYWSVDSGSVEATHWSSIVIKKLLTDQVL